MLTVIDHNEEGWQRQYLLKARENGAATYSRDIVQYHLPVIEHWATGKNVVVATCAAQSERPLHGDVLIQYMHEYRYDDPLLLPRRVARMQHGIERVIFVVAYKAMADELQRIGLEAVFLPMGIDTARVQETPEYRWPQFCRRAAYFGNVTAPKKALYASLTALLRSQGWEVDHILERRQEAAWARLRGYHYGIGVGRCALEMGALGMKVLIAGARFGGIMTTGIDVLAQRETNMNGRIVTYDRDPTVCIRNWGNAVPGVTTDIHYTALRLEDYLQGYSQGI